VPVLIYSKSELLEEYGNVLELLEEDDVEEALELLGGFINDEESSLTIFALGIVHTFKINNNTNPIITTI
jgi:hypothetical protein